MAELLTEQLQEVDQRVDPDSPQAADDVEETFKEMQTKQLTDSFQLLKSRLTLLRAKNELMTMNKDKKSTELLPYDEISKDLNDAITLAKLQELAWEAAKESFILHVYTSTNTFSEDTSGNHEQVIRDMKLVLPKHNSRVTRLNRLIMERSEKLKRAEDRSCELNHELQQFKMMLSIQRQELNNRTSEQDATQHRTKHLIFKKLDRLNISRMFIINLLGVSGINFMKYPKWADMIVKCRKQINMENLDTYKF